MSLRKRKLDTPEEIEAVCREYYLTDCNQSDIARHHKVSQGVIKRILDENTWWFSKTHKDEIAEYRRKR